MVRIRRSNGLEVVLRCPGEDWQELMSRANAEFGSPQLIGGPEMPDMAKYQPKKGRR
jgi:hypothetical protein